MIELSIYFGCGLLAFIIWFILCKIEGSTIKELLLGFLFFALGYVGLMLLLGVTICVTVDQYIVGNPKFQAWLNKKI